MAKKKSVRTGGESSFLFVERHWKPLLAGGVAILLLALAFCLFLVRDKLRIEEASALFAKASDLYEKGEKGKALKMFEDLRANYKRSPSGKFALLYIGNVNYGLGKYDEASKAYESFTRASPKSPFAALSQVNLGYCLEAKGDLDGLKAVNDELLGKFSDSFIYWEKLSATNPKVPKK